MSCVMHWTKRIKSWYLAIPEVMTSHDVSITIIELSVPGAPTAPTGWVQASLPRSKTWARCDLAQNNLAKVSFEFLQQALFFWSCQPFGAQHDLGDLSRDWFANCACGCWLLPACDAYLVQMSFPLCSFLWDPFESFWHIVFKCLQ